MGLEPSGNALDEAYIESFEGDSPSASPDGTASGGHFKRRDIGCWVGLADGGGLSAERALGEPKVKTIKR